MVKHSTHLSKFKGLKQLSLASGENSWKCFIVEDFIGHTLERSIYSLSKVWGFESRHRLHQKKIVENEIKRCLLQSYAVIAVMVEHSTNFSKFKGSNQFSLGSAECRRKWDKKVLLLKPSMALFKKGLVGKVERVGFDFSKGSIL